LALLAVPAGGEISFGQTATAERASLGSPTDLQGPSPNQIFPPTAPLITGLLVTISHLLVARFGLARLDAWLAA
jgi:hypothetical protein